MNIFNIDEVPEKNRDELVEIMAEKGKVRIERIVSSGQVTDWMVQEQEEFVILVQGDAVIEFSDRKSVLGKGDTILIRKGERHRVSYTSEAPCCIWICFFYG